MNFKKLLFFLFLLTEAAFSQEQKDTIKVGHQNWYDKNDPETVYFSQSISRTYSLGHSALENYESLYNFSFLEVDWFAFPEITIGAYFDLGYGSVKDESNEKLGAIIGTGFKSYGVQLGYYHAINKEFNWTLKAGVGGLTYRSKTYSNKFSENGTTYKLDGQIAYRGSQYWAFYLKIAPTYDHLRITTTPDVQDYLTNIFKLNIGIGIRLHLHNPDG